LSKGSLVHRIHDERFSSRSFNPGFGASRFAPFESGGAKVPTAYAATSLPCAIFETIFHDVEAGAAFKSVSWSALEMLRHSTLELTRDLRLAQLFSADLMRWGVERSQLIDTPKSAYSATRAWSPPIHDSPQAPDGLVWISRKFDEEKALMLFGTRVQDADLRSVGSAEVTTDRACLGAIMDLASRAGIIIAR
jgi:hypothetical protein